MRVPYSVLFFFLLLSFSVNGVKLNETHRRILHQPLFPETPPPDAPDQPFFPENHARHALSSSFLLVPPQSKTRRRYSETRCRFSNIPRRSDVSLHGNRDSINNNVPVNNNSSPYRKLNSVKRSDRYRPSPELQPLPPLSKPSDYNSSDAAFPRSKSFLIQRASLTAITQAVEEGERDPSRPKLKPLHWDKVRASSERATVWDQLKSTFLTHNSERRSDGASVWLQLSSKAFKLDTLLKLVDIKGVDGKTTLLHFVVQEITRSEVTTTATVDETTFHGNKDGFRKQGLQVVAGLSRDLANVKKSAGMDSDVLSGDVTKLETGLDKLRSFIKTETTTTTTSTPGKFFDSMKAFLKDAEEEIRKVKGEERKAMSMVKEVTEYFHGDAAKEEAHPLRIFMVVRDFLGVLDNVCKQVRTMQEMSTTMGSASARSFRISATASLPVLHRYKARREEEDTSSDDEHSSNSST
ncbi:LOW QUALITY PROTEIN: hypothetical protein HID58_007807 [Brassica napus]|uniref:FH2 domain-containing protein n=2 Tax=Brassica napus TaxID=3708 RepID=A0ABQ8EFG2_BRANA|nr:LOW QUALITY PROTEIN: hypothetical protein HID58_007807 [Brassica napus]